MPDRNPEGDRAVGGNVSSFLCCAALSALILLVAGCASARKYVEPVDGPRARVRFATHSPGVTVLYRYEDVVCSVGESEMMRLRAGAFFEPQPKRMGMPLWEYHENGAQEVYVAPGLFVGKFEGGLDIGIASAICHVPFAFHVEPDIDYEVVYTLQMQQRYCSVSVYELQSAPGKEHARVPLSPQIALADGCDRRKFRWQ